MQRRSRLCRRRLCRHGSSRICRCCRRGCRRLFRRRCPCRLFRFCRRWFCCRYRRHISGCCRLRRLRLRSRCSSGSRLGRCRCLAGRWLNWRHSTGRRLCSRRCRRRRLSRRRRRRALRHLGCCGGGSRLCLCRRCRGRCCDLCICLCLECLVEAHHHLFLHAVDPQATLPQLSFQRALQGRARQGGRKRW